VRVLPDWVCEVLSPSNLAHDLVYKRRVYHQAKVGHYWIVDIQREEITVLRWEAEGWLVLDVLPVDGTFRAPPFEAAAIDWNAVFGKDG
jgi:Uma2 family endonuclease